MTPSTNALRSLFLDFFRDRDHAVLPSAPIVPQDDPTLLFTAAGMVPFKNIFTGLRSPDYPRAATAQKCLRAGGKHNDLDNVGYTSRHHTFFEMLGNFSFGDYFKEEAVEHAWRLVTSELGLSPERLLVTVYVDDDEAASAWRRVAGLDDRRIIRIATSDNFWSMGDVGPCGPCSEIFFDHGPGVAGGPPGSPEADGDRFVEVWNLVFMQYEQVAGGRRVPLPRPSIDTGMGLERMAAVLQGVHDNYDIDLFRALITASAEFTGVAAGGAQRASHKIVADHLRAAAFLIAEGVLPSNEGRGYVLRRIMRRGMRHAQLLGAAKPLLHRLLPSLIAEMGRAYPELGRAETMIGDVLRLEEEGFRRTLERGLRLLDEEIEGMPLGAPLPGEVAFRLFDTYGFPLDLTQDAVRAHGRTVEIGGFDRAMAEQRAKARAAWSGTGEAAVEAVWYDVREEVGATEFLGYERDRAGGTIVAIVRGDEAVERATAGNDVLVVTNQTPFYGESGGQEGDTGVIQGEHGLVRVQGTRKNLGDLIVHVGHVEEGTIARGDPVQLVIDGMRRAGLRRAHSATHLLHAALRRRLGAHVTQRGSLVADDRLRFDFSHPAPIEAADLVAIETEVNDLVRQNGPVSVAIMARDAAIGSGAMALFGEKYGDDVRVVTMGTGPDDSTYSVELCGGTHVARTGDVAFVRLGGESGIAAGLRRIEALTGPAAVAETQRDRRLLRAAAQGLRTSPAEIVPRLETLVEERRRLERELVLLQRKLALGGGPAGDVKEIAGIKIAGRVVEGLPAKEVRKTADTILRELGSGIVTLVAVNDGRATVVVNLSDDLRDRWDAVDLLRRAVTAIGGSGGGGRRDFAQGGGPDGARAREAIAAVETALAG